MSRHCRLIDSPRRAPVLSDCNHLSTESSPSRPRDRHGDHLPRSLRSRPRAPHARRQGCERRRRSSDLRQRCGLALAARAAAGDPDPELAEGVVEFFDVGRDTHARMLQASMASGKSSTGGLSELYGAIASAAAASDPNRSADSSDSGRGRVSERTFIAPPVHWGAFIRRRARSNWAN